MKKKKVINKPKPSVDKKKKPPKLSSKLKFKSTVKLIKLKRTRRKIPENQRRKRQPQQQQPKQFSSKRIVSSSYRLLINKNKRNVKLRQKKQAVRLEKKITHLTKKLKSPPNYYANVPPPPPPPPPKQHGSPLPQSADFQLCLPCNKVYRREHFALHQKAYHPPPPPDNQPTQAPDTNCPLCPTSKKTICFENVRLLFFHFLKCHHLPDNLHNFFGQADKVKPLVVKPSLPLELELKATKNKGGRQKKGKRKGGGDKKGVACPECGKWLAGDLRRHLAAMHDKGTTPMISYPCPMDKCAIKSNSTAGLRKHLYEGHWNLWKDKIGRWFGGGVEGNFKCELCGWRGGDKWECMVHFLLGHGNKLEEEGGSLNVKCPVCEEKGGDLEVMRRHVEWIHGGEKLKESQWRCPFKEECGGRVVLSPEDFEEHWRKMHGCREAYLLRQQGKMIRRVNVAGKVGKLFKNRVCFVKVERISLNDEIIS